MDLIEKPTKKRLIICPSNDGALYYRWVKVKHYKFNFIRTLSTLYIVFVPAMCIFLSYFRVDIWSSILFKANDGTCESNSTGIGIHCFGDFNEGLRKFGSDEWNKYQGHYWLSPIDGLISKISSILTSVLNERIILILAIIIYLMLLLIPIFDIWKSIKRENSSYAVMFYIGSLGFLTAIDRLNSICFVAPLCYFFFCALIRDNRRVAGFSFLVMCLFKPQLLVLGIAILFYLGFKFAFKITILTLLGIASIVITQHDLQINSLNKWFSTILDYGSKGDPLSVDYPNNLSFARMLFYISSKIGLPNFSDNFYLILSLIISTFCIVLVFILKSRIEKADILQILLSISIMGFSNKAYSYYLILFMSAELARFKTGLGSLLEPNQSGNLTNRSTHIRKILYLLIIIPLPISIFGYLRDANLLEFVQKPIPILNPIFISLLSIFWITAVISDGFKSERNFCIPKLR